MSPSSPGGVPVSPELDPQLDALLRVCIHCGLCLGECPTYLVTGDEAESPRGRLMLLGELQRRGELTLREPLDRCLGCRHCETVCPSGVSYGALLEAGRGILGPPPGRDSRLVRFLIDHVLTRPRVLWPVARLGRRVRRSFLARLLPPLLRRLLEGLPSREPRRPLELELAAQGDVALLAGCAQRVFCGGTLAATARLVEATGSTPCLPPRQGCCGALAEHAGSIEAARADARRLIDALDGQKTVLVASAGCSAHMRRYGEIFADDPHYAEKAARVAAATVDVVVWLDRHSETLRFRRDDRRVVYHPPCHHTHAQGIVDEPMRLLKRVEGIRLQPLQNDQRCCGSAGAYSLLHPRRAAAVRREKLADLHAAAPQLILTANPGCELYLESGMADDDAAPPVRHLVEYLAERLD